MCELIRLIRTRLKMTRYAVVEFLSGSKLRIGVVSTLVVLFWLLMFGMFMDAFMFMDHFKAISAILIDYLFAFFFVSLLVMMTISNAIIAYTSLYRSEETQFLFTLPVRAENTFAYRGAECIVFSSWGMVTLVIPMILAYGIVFPVPLYFYPFALLLALLFTVLAMELGGFFALLVAVLVPRRRKTVLAVLAAACLGGLALWVAPFWGQRPDNIFSDAGVKSVIDRIAFCQHWALPSHWVSHGMLSAARGNLSDATFLTLMLLSNVAFLGVAVHRFGHYVYRRTWAKLQGASTRRKYGAQGPVDLLMRWLLCFLPARLRPLVVKDTKTFLRDPSQWSQFLLFFGLLGLYILNLPRFNLSSLGPYWHSLIAVLNLCATCLTLATLTTRFVFPQLSLEGRRIWITGLLPMRRSLILWGKFFFATAGTFAISGALIAFSDIILGLPLWMLGVHALIVLCICGGLNGLAVGLGACYPTMGTDNPSKIISSFGGTLNLICSICFIMFALAPAVTLLQSHARGVLTGREFVTWLSLGLAFIVGLSAFTCLVPMAAGTRAFNRMEF